MLGGVYFAFLKMASVKFMSQPFCPQTRNLSIAWAEVFLKLLSPGAHEISPVMVQIEEFNRGSPIERQAIRTALDGSLSSAGLHSCHEVASTIFPISLWNKRKASPKHTFDRFKRVWPRVQRRDKANRRGMYFQRLCDYAPKGYSGEPINQLEHIIHTFRDGNHRRSALQAIVFDPTRDHSNARQLGFPCLHQVGFIRTSNDGLEVVAYYSMQYGFDRAYGNYLGLCWLGEFMSRYMGKPLERVTCISAVIQIGKTSKSRVRALERDLKRSLQNEE